MSNNNILGSIQQSTKESPYSFGVTSGEVVDVNDPEQLGRIKIFCPAYGDLKQEIDYIPWASYCAPFGGATVAGARGPNEDVTSGVTTYGTWAIPQVGATALVMLIDGLPNRRIWIGCLPPNYFTHTMPHGRFDSDDKLPRSSTEETIEPLASNAKEAFNDNVNSYEYGTRVIDRQVSANRPEVIGREVTYSKKPDDINFEIERAGGNTSQTQGYTNKGSSIYSTSTPSGHSMSMDDDPHNCRTRLRTACGHQIIMDDTNERIYIETAKGKTWIEIDEKGTIDIYSSEDTSIRADGDLNLSAGKSVRIAGADGIHLVSGTEIRTHSKDGTHIRADGGVKLHSSEIVNEIDGDLAFKVGGKLSIKSTSVAIETDENINIKATDLIIKSSGYDFDGTGINIKGNFGADGDIVAKGVVHGADVTTTLRSLNEHEHFYTAPKIPELPPFTIQKTLPSFPSGGITVANVTAEPEEPADDVADEKPAYFPSRTPTHEPFPRSYLNKDDTDKDNAGESTLDLFEKVNVDDISTITEFGYDDDSVGRGSDQRNIDFNRNSKWRR